MSKKSNRKKVKKLEKKIKIDLKKIESIIKSQEKVKSSLKSDLQYFKNLINELLVDIEQVEATNNFNTEKDFLIPGIKMLKLQLPALKLKPELNLSSLTLKGSAPHQAIKIQPPFSTLFDIIKDELKVQDSQNALSIAANIMLGLFSDQNPKLNLGYYQAESRAILRTHIPSLPSIDLVTPLALSFYESKLDVLIIEAVVLVNTNLNITDFEIFFNYTLSVAGEPQIDIYITYDDLELPTSEYSATTFTLGFGPNSVRSQSDTMIPLHEIKSVSVFLVNKDPKTSRGTTTTVQTHNS